MHLKSILKLSIAFLIAAIMISCNNGGNMSQQKIKLPSLADVPASAWEKLQKKKIYFGHQSVGNNIIKGLKEIGRENPHLRLNIIRIEEFAPLDDPGFYHSAIGRNDYPKSKIEAFAQAMDDGIGNTADIAFFKFCFVDITAETNVQEVFKYYCETMEQLKKKYPKVTFVHFTVPLLRRNKPSLKSYIKKLIGKGDGFFDDSHNITRNKYNQLVREKYLGKEPLFDLAMVESTYQDGSCCAFSANGHTYYALVPEYTKDGGHLNELGQKIVAEQLLIFLARL